MTERLPPWLRRPAKDAAQVHHLKTRLRGLALHTVCEEARCPNLAECFARPTATFLLLGDVCTRACRFCNVTGGAPKPLDPHEPEHVAAAAVELGLKHVVLTSVTRDDLPDGGAAHFAATVRAIKSAQPAATVEILTPDFLGGREALEIVAAAPFEVFNHNAETVARLYPTVRPAADYDRSLGVLAFMAERRPDAITKSGFMLGLGEEDREVESLLLDLRRAGVQAVTIGQYLRPRRACLPVCRYVPPDEFASWGERAKEMGFSRVASAPLVRSSYFADRLSACEWSER
jgi:lipoic acid synthetase